MKTPEEWVEWAQEGWVWNRTDRADLRGFARAIQEDALRAAIDLIDRTAEQQIDDAEYRGAKCAIEAVLPLLEPKKPREVAVPDEFGHLSESFHDRNTNTIIQFLRTDRRDDQGRVIYEEIL